MNHPDRDVAALSVLALVRFAAELGLLAAFAYVGWWLGATTLALSVVLAVALPLAAALVWGRWVAPRASTRLHDPARFAVEVTLFALALVGLSEVGPSPGGTIAGVALWAAFLLSVPVRRRRL